jgi:mono/diheme cytochrome c family protein
MLSAFAPVLALSGGQKIGLLAFGVAFIVFALICSLVVPKRNPNFPGKHVGWYVVVVACFFIAMLAAVLVLGREKKEAHAATSPPATTTAPPSSGGGGGGGGGATAVKGDPAAGKQVFSSAGCTGCHTLKAANATGTVGPNLDQLKPPYPKIVHQVEVGGGPMPAFKNTLSAAQIQNVAAFVYTASHSKAG